jgi:predicted Co/Zn/Cd cation transporter (cation efflux family)
MEIINLILSNEILLWSILIYTVVGIILGFLFGSLCVTFGGESNHVVVWMIAWPIKLIVGIYRLIKNRKD